MLKLRLFALAVASFCVSFNIHGQFADSVVSYTAGSGVSASFTDPSRALGGPTVFIGYQDADPFNPPYQNTDLVSVGAGGSLTVQFNTPIQNSSSHAFGLDFIIHANAGFIITNGDFAGGGITDGSLFSQNTGVTRVWVSADNLSYYQLNPALAATVDTLFPRNAAGDPGLPVNPSLTGGDFAGQNLTGIRSLYAGSGGGAGYDISWAQDGFGQSVFLSSISFVRVDVLSGKSEIDSFAMVPEPGTAGLVTLGALIAIFQKRSRHCIRA